MLPATDILSKVKELWERVGGLQGSGHRVPNSLPQEKKKKMKGFISLETIADGRTLSLLAREVEAAPGFGRVLQTD